MTGYTPHHFVSNPAWGPAEGMCTCGASKPRGVQYMRLPVQRWFRRHAAQQTDADAEAERLAAHGGTVALPWADLTETQRDTWRDRVRHVAARRAEQQDQP